MLLNEIASQKMELSLTFTYQIFMRFAAKEQFMIARELFRTGNFQTKSSNKTKDGLEMRI
jgi:hypothetical protein